MADLAQFQAQASAIYDPQAAADKASLTSGYNAEHNQLELNKNDVGVNYDRAVRGVNENEKTSVDKLNSLYSQRMGGNFTGLQGNALQGLYGKDNQARADLAQNRANKLAEISGKEVATLDKYNTDSRNVDVKYKAEKDKYAYSNYDSAVKEEQRVAMEQQRLQEQERMHEETLAVAYSRGGGSGGGGGGGAASGPTYQQRGGGAFNFQGANGKTISARLYAQQTGTDFNQLLRQMAASGDSGAADVLKHGGSSKAYKALTWD